MNVKSFGASVGGVVAGLAIVAAVHVFTQGVDGGLITPITADGGFFAFIGNYLAFFFTRPAGIVMLILTIVIYLIATIVTQRHKSASDEPDGLAVLRGILIGFGSALNGVLAYNIYGQAFGDTAGLVIGIVLFLLGVISSIGVVSQSNIYQGIIGWTCWFAPMSWVVFALALIALVVSIIIGLIIGLPTKWAVAKVGGDPGSVVAGKVAQADWATGTFFIVGGIVANLNYAKTAFNLGNIGFIHRQSQGGDHREHEAGHNLNLAVFGWVFHLFGALDENMPGIGNGATAFAEQLAESNSPHAHHKIQMWK